MVVTFYPHPAIVLRGIQDPFYLTSLEERAGLLHDLGVDVIITLTFDRELASQSAEEFMADLSRAYSTCASLVVGHDFALGRGRPGQLHPAAEIGAAPGL